jgi:hypothetical protein
MKLQRGYERLMAGEDVRMMIFMPPRHGKSDMATQKFPHGYSVKTQQYRLWSVAIQMS